MGDWRNDKKKKKYVSEKLTLLYIIRIRRAHVRVSKINLEPPRMERKKIRLYKYTPVLFNLRKVYLCAVCSDETNFDRCVGVGPLNLHDV